MTEPGPEGEALPALIAHCPIIDVSFDIWFEPALSSTATLDFYYRAFGPEYSEIQVLPGALIPQDPQNSNPALLHQASYRLVGKDLSLLVGPGNLAISSSGTYPGWKSLAPKRSEIVDRFEHEKGATKPLRFGLRYVNFFPFNVLSQLQLRFLLDADLLSGEQIAFRTVIQSSRVNLLLQIANATTIPMFPNQPGSLIDIDTFMINPDARQGLGAAARLFLQDAHEREKSLFFRLLSKELLESLQPAYDPSEK